MQQRLICSILYCFKVVKMEKTSVEMWVEHHDVAAKPYGLKVDILGPDKERNCRDKLFKRFLYPESVIYFLARQISEGKYDRCSLNFHPSASHKEFFGHPLSRNGDGSIQGHAWLQDIDELINAHNAVQSYARSPLTSRREE